MSGTWEKIGFGVVWTIVGAGAAALGSSAYFTERHKGDTDEITYLRGRVHDLENKNDELRKEARESYASNQAASELVTCRAQLEDMRRVQNTAAIQEIRRLEEAVNQDERRLTSGIIYSWPNGQHTDADASTDRLLKERLTAERSDLSAMRHKLVCAP
ncbi:hypothetical protein KK141_21685 [Dyella sp. LX-66]|uniref:hypothetical protein n=1 Tax=unclassified Dyella TaxID=2634549 RepID=UPI001BE01F26|nr:MULTISPECIES: hypothetical protein [unclassified Dyella]MBT2119746.1 hypothetical protein [Dyella sp. LX-1]MBT2142173.1 hypothetical protein [Dyella sp. LX-66]